MRTGARLAESSHLLFSFSVERLATLVVDDQKKGRPDFVPEAALAFCYSATVMLFWRRLARREKGLNVAGCNLARRRSIDSTVILVRVPSLKASYSPFASRS
jgi:hypothetical protein